MGFYALLLRRSLSGCLVLLLLLAGGGCSRPPDPAPVTSVPAARYTGDVATRWFDAQLDLVRVSPGYTPPIVARSFAYSGLALYECARFGMPGHQSLLPQLSGAPALAEPEPGQVYHWALCANAALAAITREMFTNVATPELGRVDGLESDLNARYGAEVDEAVFTRSVALGKTVAGQIAAWAKTDGGHNAFNRNFPAAYQPPVGDGLWKPTDSNLALLPYWGDNRPLVPGIVEAARPDPPLPFSTDPGSPFFEAAREVHAISESLTDEQRTIAFYWTDDPIVTFTPPGHSLFVLTQVLRAEGADLAFSAEAYCKLGIALSDGFLACWQVKYQTNLIRPVTYVRRHIDPFWSSLILTPPFPEYTSGHSVQAGIFGEMMTGLFGEDYAFTDSTHTRLELDMQPRRYGSFRTAAREASLSRLYGGIHYRFSIDNSYRQGELVARRVNALAFRRP